MKLNFKEFKKILTEGREIVAYLRDKISTKKPIKNYYQSIYDKLYYIIQYLEEKFKGKSSVKSDSEEFIKLVKRVLTKDQEKIIDITIKLVVDKQESIIADCKKRYKLLKTLIKEE